MMPSNTSGAILKNTFWAVQSSMIGLQVPGFSSHPRQLTGIYMPLPKLSRFVAVGAGELVT